MFERFIAQRHVHLNLEHDLPDMAPSRFDLAILFLVIGHEDVDVVASGQRFQLRRDELTSSIDMKLHYVIQSEVIVGIKWQRAVTYMQLLNLRTCWSS